MQFLNKAQTLEALDGALQSARVLPQHRFSVEQWQGARSSVVEAAYRRCWPCMIVRSSAATEDTSASSNAGAFTSILNVSSDALAETIDEVAASMTGAPGHNEIFVQPMLADVLLSGVAFGVDPSSGAPYFVVNYDEVSARTDTVTSGISADLKTCYVHHRAQRAPWRSYR
jgi:phosphoenolpyruvate synthase/pyruvate phosphate dikinase